MRSLSEAADYVQRDGTCKCGLPCPLRLQLVFNFDPSVSTEHETPASPAPSAADPTVPIEQLKARSKERYFYAPVFLSLCLSVSLRGERGKSRSRNERRVVIHALSPVSTLRRLALLN